MLDHVTDSILDARYATLEQRQVQLQNQITEVAAHDLTRRAGALLRTGGACKPASAEALASLAQLRAAVEATADELAVVRRAAELRVELMIGVHPNLEEVVR